MGRTSEGFGKGTRRLPRGYQCVPYDREEEPQACAIAICIGHPRSVVDAALETIQSLFYEHHMICRIPSDGRPFYDVYGVLIQRDREFDLGDALKGLPAPFEVHYPGALERVKDFFIRMRTDFRRGGGPVLVASDDDVRGTFSGDPYFGGEYSSTEWTEDKVMAPTGWVPEDESAFCDWMTCMEVYPEEGSYSSSGETWTG
jgi:hypothetical protein